MSNYEIESIKLFKQGNNCSNSLYKVFMNDYNLSGNIPKPRSMDGLCGTVLTTIQILKELNKEQYIDEFKELFIKKFGYLECYKLLKNGKTCNEYIKFSVNYIYNCIQKFSLK